MRRWLRAFAWLGGGCLALVAAALLAWFGGLGPWGPFPGGVLWGEVAREPVADWSFVDAVAEVQVETRFGPLPWSVTTWALTHAATRSADLVVTGHTHHPIKSEEDGRLFLNSGACARGRLSFLSLDTKRGDYAVNHGF